MEIAKSNKITLQSAVTKFIENLH